MELISEQACPKTWTCRLVTAGGGLPDMDSLTRAVREVGHQFWVRGAELIVDGVMVNQGGRPAVRIDGGGEIVVLASLSRKIQWDTENNTEEAVEPEERTTYERLAARWRGDPCRVRVVGPLREKGKDEDPVLEVREYYWWE